MFPLMATACVGPSVEKPGGSNIAAASLSRSGGLTSSPAAAPAWVWTASVSKRWPRPPADPVAPEAAPRPWAPAPCGRNGRAGCRRRNTLRSTRRRRCDRLSRSERQLEVHGLRAGCVGDGKVPLDAAEAGELGGEAIGAGREGYMVRAVRVGGGGPLDGAAALHGHRHSRERRCRAHRPTADAAGAGDGPLLCVNRVHRAHDQSGRAQCDGQRVLHRNLSPEAAEGDDFSIYAERAARASNIRRPFRAVILLSQLTKSGPPHPLCTVPRGSVAPRFCSKRARRRQPLSQEDVMSAVRTTLAAWAIAGLALHGAAAGRG